MLLRQSNKWWLLFFIAPEYLDVSMRTRTDNDPAYEGDPAEPKLYEG